MSGLETKLYVNVIGNDACHDGSQQYPFATLRRACKEVRKLLSINRKQNITILVGEGTYYFEETLELDARDCPADGYFVRYQAQNYHKTVLSGGKLLSCHWQQWKDGIYVTDVPKGLYFDQLFVNGQRKTRARYPNADDSESGYSGYAKISSAIEWNDQNYPDQDSDMSFSGAAPRGLIFNPDDFTKKHWERPQEAIVHVFQANYWGSLQWRVRDMDYVLNKIWFGQGGTQIGAKWCANPCVINEKSRFFVENILEELDAPGEWYLDRDAAKLYYMPVTGKAELDNAKIEVPILETVLAVRGGEGAPVGNIVINGFRFCHTLTTYMEEYDIPSLGDWAIHRGGCLMIEFTRNITITNNWFDSVGGNAIFFNLYNRGARVCENRISQAGESAICFVGRASTTVGTQRHFPYECVAQDNLIYDCGIFGKQTAGVFISVAKRITVSHCTIYKMPRAGICINDGTWGGHIIEFNDIYDTCRETGDHGPINAWGRDRYWCLQHSHGSHTDGDVCHQAGDVFVDQMETVVIRNNRFTEKSGWGLDLDDGASNYHIYNNLCIGVSMKLREGAYRKVENNIWVKGANSPCFHVGNIANHDRYIRNITVMDTTNSSPENDLDFEMGAHYGEMYTLIKPPCRGPWLEEIDYNLFYNDLGYFKARVITGEMGQGERKIYLIDEWRALGFDTHSIYGDPQFVDPEHGDYTVKGTSPALALGFQNFPMEFGLTDATKRKMGKKENEE